MSSTFINSADRLPSGGVIETPKSSGVAPYPDVGEGERSATKRKEEKLAASVTKGLVTAPNGMTPTPQPAGRTDSSPSPQPRESEVPVAPPTEPITSSPASDSEVDTQAETAATAENKEAAGTEGVDAQENGADRTVPPSAESSEADASKGDDDITADDSLSGAGLKEALPAESDEDAARTPGAARTEGGEQAQSPADSKAGAEVQASTSSLKDDPGTPEECNLFVGDLARNLSEEKLEKAFQQHGKVLSVSIKRDRATGKNLGYGFVKLSSHQEARIAKDAMQGVELGGRRVRVGWAQKNTSLLVSGLDAGITTDMLVREFGRFGPLDKDLTTIRPVSKTGFVKYRYRMHAETAKKELQNRPAFGGLCPALQIEWNSVDSSSKTEDSDGAGATGSSTADSSNAGGQGSSTTGPSYRSSARSETSSSTVHVQFEGEQAAVSDVNEALIRKTFAEWGPLADVILPSNRFTGMASGSRQMPRCWALVHFPSTASGERAATDAIQALDGTTVSGMKIHCSFDRSSRMASPWKKHGMMSGGRRRNSTGGDEHRPMMPGGRPMPPSVEAAGILAGRGGTGWGGHASGVRSNLPLQHRPVPHSHHHAMAQHLPPPVHHQLQPHPSSHYHQGQHVYGLPGGIGGGSFQGQYQMAQHNVEGTAASGSTNTGDMMVQGSYGMAPYSYMSYPSVPYAPMQQGYQMSYQPMFAGYPIQTQMNVDPSMMQGQQVASGVQPVAQQPAHSSSPMLQSQGQGVVPTSIHPGQTGTSHQQAQQPQQIGTQRLPGQLQAHQAQQHQHQQQQQARVVVAQRHSGTQQQPMIMPGGSGGAAAPQGLNMNVASYEYMPAYPIPHVLQASPGPVDQGNEQVGDGSSGVDQDRRSSV